MAGDTFKPRPTIYKGIKMRSRLEAGFAQWLDEDLFRWQYEPFAVADEDHEPFGCWTPRYLGPYTWISMAPGSVPDAGLTGLARAMPPFGCPWAGDYWRVD